MKSIIQTSQVVFILFYFLSVKIINCQEQTPTKINVEKPVNKIILTKAGVEFIGGTGFTIEDAIRIKGANNENAGMEAENYFLEKQYGKKNVDWRIIHHRVIEIDHQVFELIIIELKSPLRKINFYFNITDFFGKW